ncbi:MAG: hypothetical protein ACLVJ6_14660 [Merdibacter sp.]
MVTTKGAAVRTRTLTLITCSQHDRWELVDALATANTYTYTLLVRPPI